MDKGERRKEAQVPRADRGRKHFSDQAPFPGAKSWHEDCHF